MFSVWPYYTDHPWCSTRLSEYKIAMMAFTCVVEHVLGVFVDVCVPVLTLLVGVALRSAFRGDLVEPPLEPDFSPQKLHAWNSLFPHLRSYISREQFARDHTIHSSFVTIYLLKGEPLKLRLGVDSLNVGLLIDRLLDWLRSNKSRSLLSRYPAIST